MESQEISKSTNFRPYISPMEEFLQDFKAKDNDSFKNTQRLMLNVERADFFFVRSKVFYKILDDSRKIFK